MDDTRKSGPLPEELLTAPLTVKDLIRVLLEQKVLKPEDLKAIADEARARPVDTGVY